MSDSSNPAADEIVSLTLAYQTAVVVIEDGDQDILLVRGGPYGHRRRPAVWRLPSVRLREGDDPVLAAARGCENLTGHWPSRLQPLTATVAPVPDALWTSIHAFRTQRHDLVVRSRTSRASREPREVRWLARRHLALSITEGNVGGRVTLLVLSHLLDLPLKTGGPE